MLARTRALSALVAMACGAPEPTAPPTVATTPIPTPTPFAVDTGPIPGGRLAFSYQPTGSTSRIYAVRTDGTELKQLSPDDQWAYTPTWSPDGSRLAYLRGGDRLGEIWVVRGDGSGATRIANGHSPFWLDDARVGYACPAGLCVVGADGAPARTLLAHRTPDDMYDDSFRLSPDGTTLAFVRHRGVFNWELHLRAVYLLKLDGTAERRLFFPNNQFEEQSDPTWSPDGKRLAYRDGAMTIVVNVDGGPLEGVGIPSEVPRGFSTSGPAWSPSGAQLVIGLDPREFYIANVDGSGKPRRVKVAMPSTDQWYPTGAWSWTR